MPRPADAEHLATFHESDYVAFLRTVTPDNQARFLQQGSVWLACAAAQVFRSKPTFHESDYVALLRTVTPDNQARSCCRFLLHTIAFGVLA